MASLVLDPLRLHLHKKRLSLRPVPVHFQFDSSRQGAEMLEPIGEAYANELRFFLNVGRYHFVGAYAGATACLRGHSGSLHGHKLQGSLPTRPTRLWFC